MTSARSQSWHCYRAAGAPADAKAITRLVPRRDNQRDRDVAKPIVSSKVVQTTKAIVGDWELPHFAGARRNPRDYAVRRVLRAKGVRWRARAGGECNEPRGSGPGTAR